MYHLSCINLAVWVPHDKCTCMQVSKKLSEIIKEKVMYDNKQLSIALDIKKLSIALQMPPKVIACKPSWYK